MTYDEIWPRECTRATKNGTVRFRSRLEARWSLAFERLHLEWEYEPKTFPLLSGRLYTPDFRVGPNWIEIKPTSEALRDVEKKLRVFAKDLPGRFFSITADFPAFQQRGKPTVVEWTKGGVCWRSEEEATEIFCAERDFKREFPEQYVVFVALAFESVRFHRFTDPIHVRFAMEGD